ncbi:hypothetical protein H4R21_005420, partial [Coemansia helicoidea]
TQAVLRVYAPRQVPARGQLHVRARHGRPGPDDGHAGSGQHDAGRADGRAVHGGPGRADGRAVLRGHAAAAAAAAGDADAGTARAAWHAGRAAGDAAAELLGNRRVCQQHPGGEPERGIGARVLWAVWRDCQRAGGLHQAVRDGGLCRRGLAGAGDQLARGAVQQPLRAGVQGLQLGRRPGRRPRPPARRANPAAAGVEAKVRHYQKGRDDRKVRRAAEGANEEAHLHQGHAARHAQDHHGLDQADPAKDRGDAAAQAGRRPRGRGWGGGRGGHAGRGDGAAAAAAGRGGLGEGRAADQAQGAAGRGRAAGPECAAGARRSAARAGRLGRSGGGGGGGPRSDDAGQAAAHARAAQRRPGRGRAAVRRDGPVRRHRAHRQARRPPGPAVCLHRQVQRPLGGRKGRQGCWLPGAVCRRQRRLGPAV